MSSRGTIPVTLALAALIAPGLWAAEEPQDLNKQIDRLEKIVAIQADQIKSLSVKLATTQPAIAEDMARIKEVVREVLADPEFRSKLVPSTLQAGYDRGIYIKSSDDLFMIKAQVKTQFRYIGINRQTDDQNVLGRQKRDDLSGFEWERSRIYWTGYMFTKKLTYLMNLDGDSDGENAVRVLDLFVNYEYLPGHNFRFGQMWLPQNRGFGPPTDSQFAEAGLAESLFQLVWSDGVQFHGKFPVRKDTNLVYQAAITNGTADWNDDIRDSDTNFAYTGRFGMDYNAFGTRTADIERSEKFKALADMLFAFVDDNNDVGGNLHPFSIPEIVRAGRGGRGLVDPTGTQWFQFGPEWGIKYRGFSLNGIYTFRSINSEYRRSLYELATLHSTPHLVHGGDIQVGYLLPGTKLEPIARVSAVFDDDGDRCVEYAGGANYYIRGNGLRLTLDVSHVDESPFTSSAAQYSLNDDMLMVRFQIQAMME